MGIYNPGNQCIEVKHLGVVVRMYHVTWLVHYTASASCDVIGFTSRAPRKRDNILMSEPHIVCKNVYTLLGELERALHKRYRCAHYSSLSEPHTDKSNVRVYMYVRDFVHTYVVIWASLSVPHLSDFSTRCSSPRASSRKVGYQLKLSEPFIIHRSTEKSIELPPIWNTGFFSLALYEATSTYPSEALCKGRAIPSQFTWSPLTVPHNHSLFPAYCCSCLPGSCASWWYSSLQCCHSSSQYHQPDLHSVGRTHPVTTTIST